MAARSQQAVWAFIQTLASSSEASDISFFSENKNSCDEHNSSFSIFQVDNHVIKDDDECWKKAEKC